MEVSRPHQKQSPSLEQPNSINGTSSKNLKVELFIQAHQAKQSQLRASTGLVSDDAPGMGQFSQNQTNYVSQISLPALSAAEQWDLEGFFQLIYSLSAVSFPPSDPMLWNTYSPLIIEAFFKAADDEDHFFTDNELIAAFQKCSEAFATFYGWPKHTRAEVFTQHTCGKDALEGILQLVKLAKGFGIEGEEWWELRRNLWMAFAEPFQRHGWVSEGSDVFQKLFTHSLDIFVNLGVKTGTWTYAIVSDLMAWRKIKEAQEAVAEERAIVASRKRGVVESAWETLRRAVNGETSDSPQYTSALHSQTSPENMSPSPTSTPTSPDTSFSTPLSQHVLSPEEESQENFGDLPDFDFGELMDVDPWNWNGGGGVSSNPDRTDDEGFESQPSTATKGHRESHEEIVEEAFRWSGKQLWEMTDEEFERFCSGPHLRQ